MISLCPPVNTRAPLRRNPANGTAPLWSGVMSKADDAGIDAQGAQEPVPLPSPVGKPARKGLVAGP